MRIIAGTLGGRLFESPKGHRTHPMSDKIRGALFAMLGELDGLVVLDAFAGSGALSFEAASRGARHVTAIEQDRLAQIAIAANINKLELTEQVKLIKSTAQAWSRRQPTAQFDVVLCDPPFDNLQEEIVRGLTNHLRTDGILVLSWPGHELPLSLDGLVQITQKMYGDAQLVFYQKIL